MASDHGNDQPQAAPAPSDDLADRLGRDIVGQPAALTRIIPYIQTYKAGLAPEGRPAGIFLLLGPTGTGKTRTVEALAEVIHGDRKRILKIDCGEFHAEHEVAKLIGAPPGYVGHRESVPRLSQQKISAVTSENSDLALILFDEIEKAAHSMATLLLGIMDKATLQLGDGSVVNFEKTLIFFTSNLGARDMMSAVEPGMGFNAGTRREVKELGEELTRIGLAAVRKQFSPEFVNRIDVIVTYQPLDADSLAAILDQHIHELQRHVHTRLAGSSFTIEVTPEARAFIAERGTSAEYGARELKRTIHRYLTQPLAGKVATGEITPGALVSVRVSPGGETLEITSTHVAVEPATRAHPRVLVVDDNVNLLSWVVARLEKEKYEPVTAGTLADARAQVSPTIEGALLDYLLPDGDGLDLALELVRRTPPVPVIIMTGMELPSEEMSICIEHGIPVILKPFLLSDILRVLQGLVPSPNNKERVALG